MCWKEKIQWQCYPQASERACVTSPPLIQKIYAPSSALLQGKHLPFSPFPLPLNIFCLFVILSLIQLYRYTPEICPFSTATYKYIYRPLSDELDKNITNNISIIFSSKFLFGHPYKINPIVDQ